MDFGSKYCGKKKEKIETCKAKNLSVPCRSAVTSVSEHFKLFIPLLSFFSIFSSEDTEV